MADSVPPCPLIEEGGENHNLDSPRAFVTTHWGLVLAAGESESEKANGALDRLCRTYWFPLYAYVRRLGYSPADAQDLTQSFFARLIERRLVRQADPARGRFRTFLLTALKRFLINEHAREQAAKRGGQFDFISWDAVAAEERLRSEVRGGTNPEQAFARSWAFVLLDHVLVLLREETAQQGLDEHFERLKDFVWGGSDEVAYASMAAELGWTESGVRVAVHRLRHRFGELLRAEIAHTVERPEDVEAELRYLIEIVGT